MFGSNNFLKKDPLIEAVKQAQADGELRRQAEALVNEEFGVYSRKAVVREQLDAYDARLEEAYKCMKEGEKLAKKDYDKDGKIESPKDEVWGSRFRAAKMAGKMEEEQIDELKKPTPETALKVVNRANDRDEWTPKAANRLYSAYKKRYEPKEKKVEEEQIDEISKELAQRYGEKSLKSYKTARAEKHDFVKSTLRSAINPDKVTGTVYDDTMKKRVKGMHHAAKIVTRPESKRIKEELKESGVTAPKEFSQKRFANKDAVTKAPVPGVSIAEAKYSAKAARAGEDIGKPGKQFSKIAKKAGEHYGSLERGKKVAGAILKRIRAKHMKEENLEELSAFGKAFAAAKGKNFSFGGKQYSGARASGNSSVASRPSSTPGTQGVATGKSFSAIDRAQAVKAKSGPADNSGLRGSTMPKTPGTVARDTGITGKPGGETGVRSGNTVSLDRPGNPGASPSAAPAPAPKPNAPTPSTSGRTPSGANPSSSSGLVGPGASSMMTANRSPSVTSQPGAPKSDASAGVKKIMATMNEEVQVGDYKYRIV